MTYIDPTEQIRTYLEKQGRAERAPLYHLFTSWLVEEPTEADRQRIERELRSGGVAVEPPLNGLSPESTVKLSLIENGSAVQGAADDDLLGWWKGLTPVGQSLAALAAVAAVAAVVTLLLVLAALANVL